MTSRHPLLALLAAVTLLVGLLALAPRPAAAVGTADLAVTMVGDAKHLRFGETMTLTTTVTNYGPGEATSVTLGLVVSDSYADFGGTCPDGSVSSLCDLGTLDSGASVSVGFVVMACCTCCPHRIGVAFASVFPDAYTVDPEAANNSVRVETRLIGKPPF
jgi:uncharacterized repeat protein (TIGR01451 family)